MSLEARQGGLASGAAAGDHPREVPYHRRHVLNRVTGTFDLPGTRVPTTTLQAQAERRILLGAAEGGVHCPNLAPEASDQSSELLQLTEHSPG